MKRLTVKVARLQDRHAKLLLRYIHADKKPATAAINPYRSRVLARPYSERSGQARTSPAENPPAPIRVGRYHQPSGREVFDTL